MIKWVPSKFKVQKTLKKRQDPSNKNKNLKTLNPKYIKNSYNCQKKNKMTMHNREDTNDVDSHFTRDFHPARSTLTSFIRQETTLRHAPPPWGHSLNTDAQSARTTRKAEWLTTAHGDENVDQLE